MEKILHLGRNPRIAEEDEKPNKLQETKLMHSCSDCPQPIEPYLGVYSSELREEGYGELLEIPRINLFGTQTIEEYIESKNRSVQEKLSRCGVECLRKHPPLGCVLIEEDRAAIALVDGHHRVRNLGKLNEKPKTSPVLVLSISELSEVLTQANPESAQQFTKQALESTIRQDVTACLASFRRMPAEKQPNLIYGIESMQDLQNKYSPSL
jgi:hypothetical protein